MPHMLEESPPPTAPGDPFLAEDTELVLGISKHEIVQYSKCY